MLKKSERKKEPALNGIRHGLFFNPEKFNIDYRKPLGKAIRGIEKALLEPFRSRARL